MSKSNSYVRATDYFAIVSPCSTCNNQLSEPDPINGYPACPRQSAKVDQAELQTAGLSTSQIDPLALTGLEDITDPSNSTTGLVNPVYSNSMNTILVWVASITDNGAITDSSGNIVNPGILDPGFNTKYINCRDRPVCPADNEAAYRAKGSWSEGDQLHVKVTGAQQSTTSDDGSSTPILIAGFADKVNFSYSAPRTPVNRDYGVSGT